MRTKKVLSILLLLVFLLFATGCLGGLFNNKPIITSTPEKSAKVGIEYTYEIVATDPDAADVLTYSLTEKPTGMTINETTGAVSWIPNAAQIGYHQVIIEVSDGKVSVSQNFTISVEEALLDSIVVVPSEMTIYVGNSETIESITAHYDNETTADVEIDSADVVSYSSDDEDIATVSELGAVTGISTGTATITVTYTEGETSVTDTIDVIVPTALISISVYPPLMIMYVGGSQAITSITALYANAEEDSIELSLAGYNSPYPAIATVSDLGVVTGVSEGVTTITVAYTEGGVTKIDYVEVTVTLMPII